MKISIDAIVRNPQQPRTVFDGEELKSLAESLKNDGLLNPISLEATEDPDQFILLDGERRSICPSCPMMTFAKILSGEK